MKRVIAIAAGLLLLGACNQPSKRREAPDPFVFRSLNLRQQNPKGQPIWDLQSPEARYDINRRVALAQSPRGTVYSKGKAHYRIQAGTGTVLNDGEVIQLEGAVRIAVVGSAPTVISADRVRWLPKQQRMEIDQRPVATDRQSRLTSRSAHFLLDQDKIELRGQPLLEHWDHPNPKQRQRNPAAPITISVMSANWYPSSGKLTAEGPVVANRFKPGQRRVLQQRLTAPSLQGNLRDGWLDLPAPVLVEDPNSPGWLRAQRTQWRLVDNTIASDLPFQAQLKQLAIQGASLQLDLKRSKALIPEACGVQQTGEQLQAQQCMWNWATGDFQAIGEVVFRRSSYQQITRSARLDGKIGKDGVAVFRTPGRSVTSQFTLPPRAKAPSARQPARTPVQF